MEYPFVYLEIYEALSKHFKEEIMFTENTIILTDPDGKKWEVKINESIQ